MRIGIDASRAFLKRRTGIEEYSYQVIRHLRTGLADESVILYVRKQISFEGGKIRFVLPIIDFELPEKWQVKGLWAPRFWTQVRLSLEMLFSQPDALFVPAHTVPLIHPKKTIVTIHGLEYEFSPESYSRFERYYMRASIRYSVRAASRVVAVSENTKRDLIQLYAVPEPKIAVVYEGVDDSAKVSEKSDGRSVVTDKPYFFFVGRLETRKNIVRIIEAFDVFKKETGLPHELVLAGKAGHGYEQIKHHITKSKYKQAIREIGYVSEAEKWELLRRAEALVFPSLYEGFGLPVVEAQRARIPVITSSTSSLPEISGDGAFLIDPKSVSALALAMGEVVRNPEKRADIIEKATRNADRFNWAACAQEVTRLLVA